MYPVQQAAETPLVPAQICTKSCLECTLLWKGVIKSLHCIYSIFIFGWFLKTNIFNICIRSVYYKNEYIQNSYSVSWIYSIFVFGQFTGTEYIQSTTNIFNICIRSVSSIYSNTRRKTIKLRAFSTNQRPALPILRASLF